MALLLAGCAPLSAIPAAAADTRPLLIVMYHAILKDPARAGQYILSPDALESDIAWLLSEGYSFVSLRELVDFADGTGGLPDKPALLTFDDGHYNSLTYVLPLLIEYDCRAVISVVGEYTQRYTDAPDPNPNYGYLCRDDLTALALSDRIEFANHSYAMHGQTDRRGSGRMPGESDADYARAFSADAGQCQALIADCTGSAPLAYAYPFGVAEPASYPILTELGLRVSLTCAEVLSTVKRGDPASLYGLGRFNRPSGPSSEAFFRSFL